MSTIVMQELVNATGLLETLSRPQFNQEHEAAGIKENHTRDMVIVAKPLAWWNPKNAEGSKEKKRRRTPTELPDEIKDFTLMDLYKTEDIQQISKEYGDAPIDPKQLYENVKRWTIEKRKRDGNIDGYERNDRFYGHKISKRKLRSLTEVKRCIVKHSYPRKELNNYEGSKVDRVNAESMKPKINDEVESYVRVGEMVKDHKPSRKSNPIKKCSNCHNQGHNSRTCKGQAATINL